MKRHSSKALGKKIMLSLLAAGVMSSYAVGVVSAADSGKVITGPYTATGAVDLEQITVNNGAVVLNYGGTVKYEMTEDAPDSAVYINGENSSLTANGVNFTGQIEAENGGSISLTGGSVIAGPYYEEQDDGTTELDGKTSLVAFDGAVITATGVDIQSAVEADGGGKVTIADSIINSDEGIYAADKGEIEISDSTVNLTGDDFCEGIYVELGGKITISDSEVTTDYGIEASDEGSNITLNNVKVTGSVLANYSGSVTVNDSSITGWVIADYEGASITLNGGSVIAAPSYKEDGVTPDGYTSITAEFGAFTTESGDVPTITANGVDIQSGVYATSGGKINIFDSNINTVDNIQAEGKESNTNTSIVISSTKEDNTYTAADISAFDGASVIVNSGKAVLEGAYAYRSGTVQILGGGTITATEKNEGGNYVAVTAEDKAIVEGKNLQIQGDINSDSGSKVTLTGGSVIGLPGENNLGEISATGGTIEFNKVDIQSNIIARKDGSGQAGKVVVNNSNIVANEGLCAEDGSVIELNGGADNTYNIVKVADEELSGYYLLAEGNGKIYINGGTLEADNLRELTHDIYIEEDGSTIDSADGGIVLAKDGKISTMTDQIFDTVAYDTTTKKVSDGENVKVDNTAIDYQGGTLIFNDTQYTDAYLTNAKDALLDYNNDSKTLIVMNGELVDNAGNKVTEITLDKAVEAGEDAIQKNVTVKVDNGGKNLFVGSKDVSISVVDGIKVDVTAESGFGAADLHLGVGSDGVIITGGSTITLVGKGDDSDLIKVLTDTGEAVANEALKVIVGTADKISDDIKQHGIFNIGSEGLENTLTGSITVNKDSSLNTEGQVTITGGVELNGANLNVNGELNADINAGGTSTIDTASTAQTGNITVKADSTTNITGAVIADSLEAAANSIINIGKKSKLGNLIANKIKLNGATIFLDPVWNGEDEISDASGLTVVDIDALDGNYVVGRNSLLSLGAERNIAEAAFADTGLTWGENSVSAAAYVDSSIDVAEGSLIVNGALAEQPATAANAGSVSFAANSLLMVKGANICGDGVTAAITGVTSATVDAGAKLQITNANQDGTYKILAGSGIGDGWVYDETDESKQNIGFTNQLMGVASIDKAGDHFNVVGESLSVRNKYGDAVVIADVIDDARANYAASDAAAFFNSAVDSTVNATTGQQVNALNNAAAMSELAGVSHATYSASNILTDAVADHMSLANGLDHDTDIWAHYVHNKENIDGLSVANGGAVYDAQYNGIVVGADLYKQGKGTIGAALTYIDGKVTGSTRNEAEYYGLSIYGGVQNDDSAVIGDISYLHGKNEITQNNSGYTLTGEPKSDAFSVGVRAEQSFKAGAGKFVPYAGLRYMHLGTGNYTNSIGLSYDADDANLFLLPVGVKYSAEHKSAGWTLRPIVEVGYVWAMGDRDGQQTVSLNGTGNGFGYDVTDSGSYIGRFVLEAEKANVTYGLGYEYQKGDSVKANKWMVNLNWNF